MGIYGAHDHEWNDNWFQCASYEHAKWDEQQDGWHWDCHKRGLGEWKTECVVQWEMFQSK